MQRGPFVISSSERGRSIPCVIKSSCAHTNVGHACAANADLLLLYVIELQQVINSSLSHYFVQESKCADPRPRFHEKYIYMILYWRAKWKLIARIYTGFVTLILARNALVVCAWMIWGVVHGYSPFYYWLIRWCWDNWFSMCVRWYFCYGPVSNRAIEKLIDLLRIQNSGCIQMVSIQEL